MTPASFIHKRLKSFGHAFSGIATLVKTQHNARIHLLAMIGVIALGVLYQVSTTDWALLIVAISIVWISEALNTAIEFLCDVVTTENHPGIKNAKDVAAGAVLVSAAGAVAIGALVLGPYLFK